MSKSCIFCEFMKENFRKLIKVFKSVFEFIGIMLLVYGGAFLLFILVGYIAAMFGLIVLSTSASVLVMCLESGTFLTVGLAILFGLIIGGIKAVKGIRNSYRDAKCKCRKEK